VLDGDTFEQAGQRYRLARVDAPELPGHCRPGRACVPGDPWAAQVELQKLLAQRATCLLGRRDYYNRVLVECRTRDDQNIGDALLTGGYVQLYKRSK
jgi:endonuclease YncB( thermonuclease family)